MKTARFPIGLEFDYYGVRNNKHRKITDIMTTTNSKGEVTEILYECSHDFLGQKMKELMCDTAIARSLGNVGLADLEKRRIKHAPGLAELTESVNTGAI
jgi:hypothetical protein